MEIENRKIEKWLIHGKIKNKNKNKNKNKKGDKNVKIISRININNICLYIIKYKYLFQIYKFINIYIKYILFKSFLKKKELIVFPN